MEPVIFCDYGNTISTFQDYTDKQNPLGSETLLLLDNLQEMQNNGALIFLATDGSEADARYYHHRLKEKGYDFFADTITRERLQTGYEVRKYYHSYWKKVEQRFNFNLNEIILLDDDKDVLDNAMQNNITIVPSFPRQEAIYNLHALYQLKCEQ